MSREQEFIQVGQIHQTHGLSGEVNTSFVDTNQLHQLIKKGQFCFIEIKNQTYIPYKILTCQKNGLQAIITFDMFDTIDKSKHIAGKKLFLHIEQIPKSYLQNHKEMWIDYAIIDDNTQVNIGIIDDVLHTPGQTLAQITKEDSEILIPLIDDLIVEINHQQKTIRMNIPDGLLDL